MKRIFCLLIILPQLLPAQIITVQKGTSYPVQPDMIGLNGNVTGQHMPWNNPNLLAGFIQSGATNIRYPAGTIANYWDWDKGWIDNTVPDSLMIDWVVTEGIAASQDRYPLENFATAIKASGATPIYVLNMLSKDLAHSLRGLRRAKSLGLPVRYIELGNELFFNLPFERKVYPTPDDYGKTCYAWIAAIKQEFPDAQCAVLATELNRNDRHRDWNKRVLAAATNADAVIFHAYTPFGIDDARVRNNNQAGQEGLTEGGAKLSRLAYQQQEMERLKQEKYQFKMFNTARETALHIDKMWLPDGMPVWATEFNVRADNSAIRGTWANALFLAAFYNGFFDTRRVSITCLHNILGPLFGAIYNNDRAFNHVQLQAVKNKPWVLSAGGVITNLYAQTLKGATEMTKLQFNLPATNEQQFPPLQGWVANNKKGFLVNFSDKPMTIETSVLPGKTAKQHSAPLDLYVQGFANMTFTKAKREGSLVLPPHSFTILE